MVPHCILWDRELAVCGKAQHLAHRLLVAQLRGGTVTCSGAWWEKCFGVVDVGCWAGMGMIANLTFGSAHFCRAAQCMISNSGSGGFGGVPSICTWDDLHICQVEAMLWKEHMLSTKMFGCEQMHVQVHVFKLRRYACSVLNARVSADGK